MWLTKFKIALVEKDIEKLAKLMENVPQLDNNKEREEALYLINEASELVHNLKDDVSDSMNRIRKNLNFLKSTEHKVSSRLDIKL